MGARAYAAFVLLLGCGGRSERIVETASVDRDIQATCADLAQAMCSRRTDCEAPTLRHARYADEADCRSRTELACADWATLPGVEVTVDTLASCAANILEATCRDVTSLFYVESPDLPYCLPAGTRPEGEACISDAQCGSRHCYRGDDGGCGICATTPGRLAYGYEGDACDDIDLCETFLSCEAGTCIRTACAAPGCRDRGYSCTGLTDTIPSDCALGTECTAQNGRGSGSCTPYVPEGGACNRDEGPSCEYPALCIDGSCRLPRQLDCP